MKKLFTLILILCISFINAQYTHYFKGYSRDNNDEIQFSFIPLSVSNDLELNQFEAGWRKGANNISFRYGLDNYRTNYFDINSNVYFWITKHIDVTAGAGFGVRTNILNGLIKHNSERYYIPYNIGIVIKPSNSFQIISKMEKFDLEHNWYWQTGILIKFKIKK